MNVAQAYSAVAELYIGLFGAADKVDPDDLALIRRHLAGRAGPVLDLGCGPGHITRFLRSLGADARGVDVVPEFIAHARAADPDGDYRLESIDELELAEHSVGGILSWYSLIHRPPREVDGVLAAFHRALAPGGALVIGFFVGEGPFEHKVTTAYRYTPDEMSRRLADVGFTEVERLVRLEDPVHRPHAAIAATR